MRLKLPPPTPPKPVPEMAVVPTPPHDFRGELALVAISVHRCPFRCCCVSVDHFWVPLPGLEAQWFKPLPLTCSARLDHDSLIPRRRPRACTLTANGTSDCIPKTPKQTLARSEQPVTTFETGWGLGLSLPGISETFRRSTFITSSAALAAALGVTGECLWLTGVRALATSHQVRFLAIPSLASTPQPPNGSNNGTEETADRLAFHPCVAVCFTSLIPLRSLPLPLWLISDKYSFLCDQLCDQLFHTADRAPADHCQNVVPCSRNRSDSRRSRGARGKP